MFATLYELLGYILWTLHFWEGIFLLWEGILALFTSSETILSYLNYELQSTLRFLVSRIDFRLPVGISTSNHPFLYGISFTISGRYELPFWVPTTIGTLVYIHSFRLVFPWSFRLGPLS